MSLPTFADHVTRLRLVGLPETSIATVLRMPHPSYKTTAWRASKVVELPPPVPSGIRHAQELSRRTCAAVLCGERLNAADAAFLIAYDVARHDMPVRARRLIKAGLTTSKDIAWVLDILVETDPVHTAA